MIFKRQIYSALSDRMLEKRRFIQVLAGPRQSGKTTLARQLMDNCGIPTHYVSADEPTLQSNLWLNQQWDTVRLKLKNNNSALFIIDEVQKIPNWSETVKRLWDEDTASKKNIKIILLGSSPLLVQKGLTESLAGRFEVIPVSHWSYDEMRQAFGFTLDQYLYFGGYPGAAALVNNHTRWSNYIIDSLIETTISRDILLLTRVDKPALLRRLFHLGCEYSGQIISYQKMMGQLQDAGNTTTLAHYLDLLSGSGLLTGISKFAGEKIRQKGSSPKLLALNTALMSVLSGLNFTQAQEDKQFWGRITESAAGAHLFNSIKGSRIELFYWLGNNKEVDFVIKKGKSITAIEIKSNRKKTLLPGMDAFCEQFKVKRKLLIGGQGMSLEQFFITPIEDLFE